MFQRSNFMELSPSWNAASRSAAQEVPNIFLEEEGLLPVHKFPPLVPIPSFSSIINFNIIHLRLVLPGGLFHSFPPKPYIESSYTHACYIPDPYYPP